MNNFDRAKTAAALMRLAKEILAVQTPLERLRANYAKEKQKLEAMLKASEALFIYGTVLTARFSLGQGQEDRGDWSVHVSLDTRELPPVRGNCSDLAAAEPAVAALKNAAGKVPAEWKQIKDTFSKMNAQAGKLNALLNQIRKIRAQMD